MPLYQQFNDTNGDDEMNEERGIACKLKGIGRKSVFEITYLLLFYAAYLLPWTKCDPSKGTIRRNCHRFFPQ